MNRAIATPSALEVAKAFGAVSEAAAEISRAVAQEDEMNREAFRSLGDLIKNRPDMTPQALNALIISRSLERVGDHATNIAEDVIFWVRGADVRHGANQPERASI